MAVLYVSDALHAHVKHYATENGTTMQLVTRAALESFLEDPFPIRIPSGIDVRIDGRARGWWLIVRFWRGEDWLEGESGIFRLSSTAELPAVAQSLAAEMFAPDPAPDLAPAVHAELPRFRQLLARTHGSPLRVPFRVGHEDWFLQLCVYRERPSDDALASP